MDQKTFFEYWATPGKYVSQPNTPLLSYNQAPAIDDSFPYGVSCRQIAFTILVHWEAARITEYRTFQKMIRFVNEQDVTDENIWEGSANWVGLYDLTFETSLEVLIDPDLKTLFTHDSPYHASLATPNPNPEPWWQELANEWLKNDLALYQVAVILLFFDFPPYDIAARLQIPENDTRILISEAQQGILDRLQKFSANEHERIQDATDAVIAKMSRIDLPQEELR